ncbi:MAG: glycosyltransferase [Okeania sp. SIO2G4]|nr:glycosyltransferase [Okeania sp. SIO4D6]NEP73516.1 glycosyltransferase [Okeania sp. SIO2G5]NEP95969.1 glycosyltransferase [Okeania sp. SIO2F5]NEQ92939.1 glycosyltransferase [Okeania sp. SIO2G4]
MESKIMPEAFFFVILLLQLPATAILLSRLIKGPTRQPPLKPDSPTPELVGKVTVVIPTLNEATRITPCLLGLSRQSYEVREFIVVDSNSVDDTQYIVKTKAETDPRFRLITDDPLPSGWVGRPWALHTGFLKSSPESEWFLGVDADIQPNPGLVASLVKKAEAENYDLISLSPQFILKYPGELWLQPALLITLVYRFGPTGTGAQTPERVMANGQCFLCRRSVLSEVGGYSSAKGSFCDDVTLARNIAAQGFKVGFLDGAKVLQVRMYEGMAETWQEWGRSLDLKDASPTAQVWSDLWLLSATQGLPLLIVLSYLLFSLSVDVSLSSRFLLFGLNLFLLLIRFALLLAIAPAYDLSKAKVGWLFWLSPLADPLAVLRIFLSAMKTPKKWRGRVYE